MGKQINHNFILYFNTMDRDGILKQLGEQKSAIYCQYEEKAEEVTGEIRHCKKKGRWFVAAQLSTFLLAVISIAIYATYYADMIIVASGIFFVFAYIAARRLDDANSEKLERLRAMRAVYMNETAYLNGISLWAGIRRWCLSQMRS